MLALSGQFWAFDSYRHLQNSEVASMGFERKTFADAGAML